MSEFSYRGDASFRRPDATLPDAAARYVEAVYLRANPAGPHEELWYHVFGCRSWITVRRNTRTHEMLVSAGRALGAGNAASGGSGS